MAVSSACSREKERGREEEEEGGRQKKNGMGRRARGDVPDDRVYPED